MEVLPGPGAYDDMREKNLQQKQKGAGSKPFLDGVPRDPFKESKEKRPGVGMYDLKLGSIEDKVSQ